MSSKIKKTRTAKRYFQNKTDDEKPKSKIPVVKRPRIQNEQKQKFGGKRKKKSAIDPILLEKHSRGEATTGTGVKTTFFKDKLKRQEIYWNFANEQAARTEILRNEEEGYIIPEENETTAEYTQEEIVANVDITAAAKHFNLDLNFGPYRMRYTKNGRHLLLGGRMGHVAAFDWVTKRLHCEMNVTEEVYDIAWLHIETMYAVGQKNWVHIYDNQGTELHCIKKMNRVTRLEFLPYHFLLASGNDEGYLCWLDVSIGQMMAQYNSKLGPIKMMCQNPSNGVLCIGGSKGVVSMWSPSVQEPLAKMLCHSTPMSALAVDPQGMYLATAGLERKVKIWDIRELSGPVVQYQTRMAPSELAISQRGLLAMAMGNVCEIYRKPNILTTVQPYLRQRCRNYIHGMRFSPYEDVLGIAHATGFTSLLVPGAGESNFDAIESNPFQTKSQRREYEVHALLDKIPMEFIALDPNSIANVDVPTLKEKIQAKKRLLFLKAPELSFERRKKMKKKSGTVKASKAKKIVREQHRRDFISETKAAKNEIFEMHKHTPTTDDNFIPLEETGLTKVLNRFKPQKRRK